jgi:hypothetical protein
MILIHVYKLRIKDFNILTHAYQYKRYVCKLNPVSNNFICFKSLRWSIGPKHVACKHLSYANKLNKIIVYDGKIQLIFHIYFCKKPPQQDSRI